MNEIDVFELFINGEDELMANDETKSYCIGMYGSFPYSYEDKLEKLFEERLKLPILKESEFHAVFPSNQDVVGEMSCWSGGGKFDIFYVVSKEFDSIEKANEYIENMFNKSILIKKESFSDISLIDSDKLANICRKNNNSSLKRKSLKKTIEKEFSDAVSGLANKYKDNSEALGILSGLRVPMD